jgi:predicted nucleic acid-binding protein
MADALFDTTVLIDYYRGDVGARRLVDAVRTGVMTASFSPVTSYELWIGIRSREEELDFLAVLRHFEEAPLTSAMVRQAAYWLRDTRGRPTEDLIRDALIAVPAAVRDEVIYTRNVRDFLRFYPRVQVY